MDQRQRSDQNPLYLVQTDRVAGAVIELGRARRFVVRYLLRMLVDQLTSPPTTALPPAAATP